MPITCKEYVIKSTDCASLAEAKANILAAAKAAEEKKERMKYEVVLPLGKHALTETFRLSAKENPELNFLDLSLRAEKPGTAEIHSLVRLDGKKFVKAEGKSYFTYDFAKEDGKIPLFRDLFLNFNHLEKSRSRVFYNIEPITEEERRGEYEREGFFIPLDIAKQMADAPLGTPEIMIYLEWDFAIFHIVGIDLEKTRVENGETYAFARIKEGEASPAFRRLNPYIRIENREMYVMNAPGLIERNTYAYDYESGVLYIDPENPEYMGSHAVEYPALEVLFALDGVSNVTLDGLTFYGITAPLACQSVYFSGQANTLNGYQGERYGRVRAAAVLAQDVKRVTVSNCYFRDLGGNGVQVVDYSVGVTVKDSRFQNVAMCAVTVGNPGWYWEQEKNRTFAARVENCFFRHIAYEYPSAPCIYFAQVDGLKILHNTIEDCAYSAISVGWNWSPAAFELGEKVNIRNAEIAYNRFDGFMQLLKDGGAIYVLGGNANRETTPERFNCMHDNYAIAHGDRTQFTGKYGYYCDGAASNWEVRDSVMFNVPRFPVFSQPHPQALSYHNHFDTIYANTQPHPASHVPMRDVVRTNYIFEDVSPEEFFLKHPEAKRICDAAGSDLYL